jgi:predicted O-methyltransferase YrrM
MPEILAHPTNAAETSFLIPYYRSLPVYADFVEINQKVSMLHPDVLALLYHLAGNSLGGILEIGPYIGGSTIAMSKGIRNLSKSGRILSIEKGGSSDHPQHGSLDIVADLHRNLEQWGVDQNAKVIVGESRDLTIIDQVINNFSSEGLGLFFIDADGLVDHDFAAYNELLHAGTYIVVDDYFTSGPWAAPEKVLTTKQVLDGMESDGKLECFGVYGWGTWVGRMK